MWTEPNGKIWRIRENVGGEKITLASGYATKTAADNALILMKADVLRGDALIPRGGELTLAEWVDTWWPTYKRALKETSRTSIQGIIDRYIKSMLGHLTLAEIADQPITVQRWVNDLLDGKTTVKHPRPLASKTVRNAHGQLYVIFAAAITNKLIRHNPCEHTLLPEEDDGEMRFLDYEEAATLIKNVPDEWRPLIMLFLATGLRWSEAMGLRVRDIELAAGRLYVRLNRVEVGGRFHDQTPKTKRGKRYVSFPTFIGDILAPLLKGKGKEHQVFTAKRGGDIRHKEFYVVWHEVRVLAGLHGLRLHDLRHTHISWLIAANVPLSAISRRAGHKSVAFTDERYGHLLKIVDEGVIEAVESAMSKIEYRGDVGESDPAQPPATPA